MNKFSIYLFFIFLISCAAPQTRSPQVSDQDSIREAENQIKFAYDTWIEHTNRVNAIAAKIRLANANICEDFSAPFYGFDVWTIQDFEKINDLERKVLTNSFQLRENLKVKHVTKDSPADKGGLMFGDEIDEINGDKIKTGYLTKIRESFYEILEKHKNKTLNIKVWRDKKFANVTINPVKACKSVAFVTFGNEINAYADGNNIFITRGMLNFTKDDLEIATVISHEIAHNTMHHIDMKQNNATIGAIFGAVIDITAAIYGINTNGDFTRMGSDIAGRSYSVEFEQEADYVGTYYLYNAGYNIENSSNFWRRMAAENPDAIFTKTTHPSSPERFVAINQTVNEIKRKVANNEILKPDLKESVLSEKKSTTASLEEQKINPTTPTNICDKNNINYCASILDNYLNEEKKFDDATIKNAEKEMMSAKDLNDSQKLILYDFYDSKTFNNERDYCSKILDELIGKNNNSAILRAYKNELTSFFIAFNKDKKIENCKNLGNLNTDNFKKRDNQILTELNKICKE